VRRFRPVLHQVLRLTLPKRLCRAYSGMYAVELVRLPSHAHLMALFKDSEWSYGSLTDARALNFCPRDVGILSSSFQLVAEFSGTTMAWLLHNLFYLRLLAAGRTRLDKRLGMVFICLKQWETYSHLPPLGPGYDEVRESICMSHPSGVTNDEVKLIWTWI